MNRFFITEFSRKYYEDYDRDLEIKRPLRVTEVEAGVILPAVEIPCKDNTAYLGGVLDKNGNFVPESATPRNKPEKALTAGYALDKEPAYRDETVIYGGVLYEFYGHVLLETSARLWYYFKHNPNKYRVVFDVVPGARGKFREFFELWDIPYNDDTFITEPTRYKRVIVPEEASRYATSWHQDYAIPFEYMKSKVQAGKYEKIYFTRTHLLRNPVCGETQIEDIFRRNGFSVVAPETLSLREQISLLKGCKCLACFAGTLACQVLFCENGASRIVLNRAFEPAEAHQIFDQLKGLHTTTVDVSLNPLPVTHVIGPWICGLTEPFLQFLKEEGFRGYHERNLNVVAVDDLVVFLRSWHQANRRFALSADEVKFSIARLRYSFFGEAQRSIYKLLYKFCFGRLRRTIKAKTKLD